MVPSRLAGLISDLHHRCRASHMAKVGDSLNQADSCRPEAQSTQQPGFNKSRVTGMQPCSSVSLLSVAALMLR